MLRCGRRAGQQKRPGTTSAGDGGVLGAGHLSQNPGDSIDDAVGLVVPVGDEQRDGCRLPSWTEGFGLALKASGWLPLDGDPDEVVAGEPAAGLFRWRHKAGDATAAALNHRVPVPVPKLKRLAREG